MWERDFSVRESDFEVDYEETEALFSYEALLCEWTVIKEW